MYCFQRRICVGNEELSKLVVNQQTQAVMVKIGRLCNRNVYPGLLSNIWKREKQFLSSQFLLNKKRGVFRQDFERFFSYPDGGEMTFFFFFFF